MTRRRNQLTGVYKWYAISVALLNGVQAMQNTVVEETEKSDLRRARTREINTRIRIAEQKEERAQELHAVKLRDAEHKKAMQEARTGVRYAVCVSCNTHFGERFIGAACQNSQCRTHEPLIETFLNI